MNLASVIRVNASNLGDKPAILYGKQIIRYAELWTSIEGIAAALQRRGIGPGDRVGLSMKDHPLHLMAHYAVARLGAIILPVDHRWTATEKKTAVDTFSASLVVTDSDADLDGINTLVLDTAAIRTDTSALAAISDDGDQPLLVSLSSGTTGKPKGAIVTHQNLYERFVSQWAAIGYDSNDCFAILTPLFFGAGRSFAMCMLAAGGTVRIAPPPLQPDEIIAVLQDSEVTATFLPPSLLRRLLPLTEDHTTPLFDNINYLLVSGEPLYSDEALECREKICKRLVGYYASSEGGGISILKPDDFATHAQTVGTPTFRTEVQIVDEGDAVLPADTTGRLRYRGPGVATRFLDSDGNEQDAGKNGWFYPGDLAERLSSGHIALRGRDKDVIIRGGVNIYPAEIEATLLQHEAIRECAVIGRDDTGRGQLVIAFVVAAREMSDDELDAFCCAQLAPYKVPARFITLAGLPKSNSGKTDKKALLQQLNQD